MSRQCGFGLPFFNFKNGFYGHIQLTRNWKSVIFIVAPCILIFTQFIHQQMNIY